MGFLDCLNDLEHKKLPLCTSGLERQLAVGSTKVPFCLQLSKKKSGGYESVCVCACFGDDG